MTDNTLEQELLKQFAIRPYMEITDCVKLLYTGEFGGGHMIPDAAASLNRLMAEYAAMPSRPDAEPLLEEISSSMHRLNLRALKDSGLSLKSVNRMFVSTVQMHQGSMAHFTELLDAFERMGAAGRLPYSGAEVSAFLAQYRADGHPALSHSDAYRQHYAPAYRVVHSDFARYQAVYAKIDMLLRRKPRITIAIEGNSGTGKSTLAAQLENVFDANVFAMDDFFLPQERKTAERLAAPGGNVDYERFRQEIAANLNEPSLRYQKYDCANGTYVAPRRIHARPVAIVEGVYGMHPKIACPYDLRIFLKVDPDTQSQRILARNGAAMHRRFVNQWIPLENQYFEAYGIEGQCDMVFDTSGAF